MISSPAAPNELPEGWAIGPLLELCKIIRGVSYKKGEAETKPASGLVPILRANNIGDGQLDFDNLQYVPKVRVSELQRLQLAMSWSLCRVEARRLSGKPRVSAKNGQVDLVPFAAFFGQRHLSMLSTSAIGSRRRPIATLSPKQHQV